jgi:hypothetical protein
MGKVLYLFDIVHSQVVGLLDTERVLRQSSCRHCEIPTVGTGTDRFLGQGPSEVFGNVTKIGHDTFKGLDYLSGCPTECIQGRLHGRHTAVVGDMMMMMMMR